MVAKKRILLAAAVLVAAPLGRADAGFWDWFKPKPEGAVHVARLRVVYTIAASDEADMAGTFPAPGVRVGISTHNSLFGSPVIDAAGETDSNGRVTITYKVRPDEKLTIRVETDGAKTKTFKGAWNVFATPHKGDVRLGAADSTRDLSYDLSFQGEMNLSLGVHAAGTRARAFGERVLASAIPAVVNKVTYSYPGWLYTDKQIAYCFSPTRIVVPDSAWARSHQTVFHETGHTFWLSSRGYLKDMASYLFEPSLKFNHSFTAKTGSTHLAMSEGLADWFAAHAKDDFGTRVGRPDIANHSLIGLVGERHGGNWRKDIPFAAWGEDNEVNVGSALFDLVDLEDDDQGVVAGCVERSHLGTQDDGVRAVFQAVKSQSNRSFKRFSLTDLWRNELQAKFGAAGADALRLNGIPVQ